MKHFSSPRLGARAVGCLLWLYTGSLFAQPLKEDRNNYPRPQKNQKVEVLVRQKPFVFSPHLSYKEQKAMQMTKKRVGGITFSVKTLKRTQENSGNSKHLNLFSKPRRLSGESLIADTTALFIRYELSDSTNR
ncbi:hypothetical protein [Runella sp.]|jgi:hypothetical protein|uniref:hypothetical protein n=1 Tax=Runella sp. TaxID=1960881 RepID=UPI00262C1BF9|nr:hypothetical protein [Runella sp.]